MTTTSNYHKKIKLNVVIINYHSSDQTIQLIDSILDTPLPNIDLNIVCADNSNNINEHKKLTTYKKTKFNFDIIFNTENLGFGKAINQAVKSFNSGFLLLVNPDVILNKNTIKLLIEHANENSKQGVWGGITLNENLKQDYRHAWREPTLLRTFCWSFYFKFSSNTIWY